MNIFYNIAMNVFKAGAALAAHGNVKARRMVDGQRHTFDYLHATLDPQGGYYWFHAASLGEFEQARPLIEMLRREQPSARILLTFFSSSGYEVRKDYDQVDAVCYLPIDTAANARRFVATVKPRMAIFVKYEFWGNYLEMLRKAGIPTYIVSCIMRPSQIFFKPWGGTFRKMLRCFDTMFVQNDDTRRLLASIGIERVVVAGDTRYDRVAAIHAAARRFPLIEEFVSTARHTLVMGSSWQPDEDIAIPYCNARDDLKVIIAPHEFDEQRLALLEQQLHGPVARYSRLQAGEAAAARCLIIDSFGLLSSLYRYGDVALVGGGFGRGIHNINEAAAHGLPVLFGPKHEKFQEAHELLACGGGFTFADGSGFAAIMDTLLADSDARSRAATAAARHIAGHVGATRTIYQALFSH